MNEWIADSLAESWLVLIKNSKSNQSESET